MALTPKMVARLEIAAIFIAVGLGALAVTVAHDWRVLVPHPPYGPWILVRVFALSSLSVLGTLLVFGVQDDLAVFDEGETPQRAIIHWNVIGIAFLISVLCTATFIAASALVDYLDRVITRH